MRVTSEITREKNRIRERLRRLTNPQPTRDSCRKWRENNWDRNIEIKANWYRRNSVSVKARLKRWRKKNPSKYKAQSARRRAYQTTSINTLTALQWECLLIAYKHRCAYCGKKKKMTQDHVIPLSKGGEHTIDNVVPACRGCNSRKGNRG